MQEHDCPVRITLLWVRRCVRDKRLNQSTDGMVGVQDISWFKYLDLIYIIPGHGTLQWFSIYSLSLQIISIPWGSM